jgi:thiol:disulfide interchange protein
MAPAYALEIAPYSAQALAQKQQAGEAVSLHFHANWCPTCLVQEKAFNTFKGDATVPGTLLVVDYDQERELKRQMGIRSQSTLIVFKGQEQKHRSGGVTDPQALKTALQSAQ